MTDDSRIYLRPSTVQSAMLCGGRPGLKGRVGFNYQPNEALMFGSGVHWAIEQVFEHSICGEDEIEAELHNIFVKDVPEGIEATPFNKVTTKGQRHAMAKEIVKATQLWVNEVKPHLPKEVPVVEERLAMRIGTLDEREVWLRGTPDAVYPEAGIMVDWKTAGRAWSADKASGQLQRIVYPMMHNNKFPDDDINQFDYWVYDRSAQWWNKYPTDVGNHRARTGYIQNAMAVAQQLEDETWTYALGGAGGGFKARNFLCNPQYCDAWGVCDGKYLIADGRADEPALTLKEKWA